MEHARQRRHIVSAIVHATGSWSDVLAVISESPTAEAARLRLCERFGLDEVQATALMDIQFRRVAGLERQRLSDELSELESLITRLEGDL